MRAGTFVLGAAAGAAVAWFMDPDAGNRRRAIARDKAQKYVRRTQQEAERKASYAAGHAKGAAHAVTPGGGRPPAEERLNDPALARKVETEIFRGEDVPKGSISVNVEDGVAYLRGEVDPSLIERLGEQAGKVEGVRGVENLLHAPGEDAPSKPEEVVEPS